MFHSLRLAAFAVLAAGLCVLVSSATAGGDKKSDKSDDQGFTELFNGKDLTGWKIVPESAKDTFIVKEGVVDVSGKPNGYFHIDKSYKNYVLRFDWKFIKDGNSGLLVHIQKHAVWPKSIEVQGQQSDHGRIFAIGGAKGKFTADKKAQKEAIKVGDWNTTEVTVNNGEMISKINGTEVSRGMITDDSVTEGPFGFQSEGTHLQFKNIKIKILK